MRERQRGDVVFREEEVVTRIGEVAAKIAGDIRGLNPIVVPMYRGAKEVTDELLDQFEILDPTFIPPTAPMKVSRYDNGQAREPRVEIPVKVDVSGRHLLLVDEIIEDGESMDVAEDDLIRIRKALNVVRFVLVKRTSKGAKLDYVGLNYDGEEWLEGWGADNGLGEGRQRRDIIISYRQPSDLTA